MQKEMSTLTETIEKFRTKQFIHDFHIKDDYLVCDETGEKFSAEELIIERTGRYEGDSNPDDMSVIYAITANSGTQGILIDAFGAYSNPAISEFIRNVPVKEIDPNQVSQI
ncbi:MAG TPA: phosphoribosylpyrophosphate synthetase [Ignavibacteria bacterium]|nr:phosphoribosylpyrophosphate synthetase [Ignavibacteria bacterium]